MNELTKQLIDQARKKPCGNSWTYCNQLEFEERIVELITDAVFDECSRICEDTIPQHHMKQTRPTHNEALLLAACCDCANAIQERKKTWDGNMR